MAYTRKASASQIILYNKCPFSYYREYKLKQKPPATPALIKGSLVHAILEKFYDINIRSGRITKYNYNTEFQLYIEELMNTILKEPRTRYGKTLPTFEEELHSVCADDFEYIKELVDCKKMLRNFVILYCMQLEQFIDKFGNIQQSFYMLRPKFRELELSLEDFVGYADQVFKDGPAIVIDDHKSSTIFGDGFSDDHELQLMLYCYAYYIINDVLPTKARINYLRYGVRCQYRFAEDIIEKSKKIISDFLMNTESEDPSDYPLNVKDKFCTCKLSEHPDGKGFKSGFKCGHQKFCDEAIENGTAVILNETEE